MTHALKVWPAYYLSLENGTKTFELRKDDRPFKEGDTVLLQEFDQDKEFYTGKEIAMKIEYILRDAEKFGLKKGYVILGLKEKE